MRVPGSHGRWWWFVGFLACLCTAVYNNFCFGHNRADNSGEDAKAAAARAKRVLGRIQKARACSKTAADLPNGSDLRFAFEYYEEVKRPRRLRGGNTVGAVVEWG